MVRNVLGSVLALAGAAAAVLSPFRDWYDGRLGRQYRIEELFTGVTAGRPGPLGSVFLAFVLAAVLTVFGVALRSRLLVAAAGVLVLGFTVLWMVRQGQALGGLTVAGDGSGLGWGVAGAVGGGVLLLAGAAVMSGRRGRGRGAGSDRPYSAPGREHPDTWPPTQEPGPSVQTSTLPEPEPYPYTGPSPAARPGPEGRGAADQDTVRRPVEPDTDPGTDRPPHP